MTTQSEFDALSQMSEASLLETIGDAVSEGPDRDAYSVQALGLGARLPRGDRLRLVANKWIADNRALFHKVVCENDNVRKALSAEPGTTIEGFKLLVDAFASVYVYVPAASLAALVMRRGLGWVCP